MNSYRPLSLLLFISILCALLVPLLTVPAPVSALPAASSCQEYKSLNPAAGDGTYSLLVSGKTVNIYCHDMSGSPKEYITLPQVGDFINYSMYRAGDARPGTDVYTRFTKLRIHLGSLIVDTEDFTFASWTGAVGDTYRVGFASAGNCIWSYVPAYANINLTGTPFAVAPDQFWTKGWYPYGQADYSSNNQIVDIAGGGYCGGTGTKNDDGSKLKLALTPDDLNQALHFHNAHLVIASDEKNSPAGGDSFTLSAWIKPEAEGTLYRKKGLVQGELETFLQYSGGKMVFGVQHVGETGLRSLTSASSIPANQWTHITAVKSGSLLSLYVNGRLDQRYREGSGYSYLNASASTGEVMIGAWESASGFYQGGMRDFRMWKKALSTGEIAAVMSDTSVAAAELGIHLKLDGNSVVHQINEVYEAYIATTSGFTLESRTAFGSASFAGVSDMALHSALPGRMKANDTYTLVTSTSNGSLSFSTSGNFVYTPNAGFAGSDTFAYTVTNPIGTFGPYQAAIQVIPRTAGLSSLEVNGSAVPLQNGITSYRVIVPSGIVNVTASAQHNGLVAFNQVYTSSVAVEASTGPLNLKVVSGVGDETDYTVLLVTDAQIVQLDKAALTAAAASILGSNPSFSQVTSPLTLPAVGANGSTITWTSTPGLISPSGSFMQPAYQAGDQTVTLTASLQHGAVIDTLSFPVTLLKGPPSHDVTLTHIELSTNNSFTDLLAVKPGFTAENKHYYTSVTDSVYALYVRPTVSSPTSTVQLRWNDQVRSVHDAVYVASGINSIDMIITAESGLQGVYTLTVNKGPDNAAIGGLLYLNGGGAARVIPQSGNVFHLEIGPFATSAVIQVDLLDPAASFSVSGATRDGNLITIPSLQLYPQPNTFVITVTAQNGAEQQYTLMVTRHAEPADAQLDLTLDGRVDIRDTLKLIQVQYDYDYNGFNRDDVLYYLRRIQALFILNMN